MNFRTTHSLLAPPILLQWISPILTVMLLAGGCQEKSVQEGYTIINTDTVSQETRSITLPGSQTVTAKVQVVKPLSTEITFKLTGKGYITADEGRNRTIPARVGGRVDRLYVKYNYQYVHKGEKIMDLYSPELNTYIEEYIYIKQHVDDSVLRRHAEQKLALLGLTPAIIKQLDRRAPPLASIPLHSPFEGYVLNNPSVSRTNMEGASNSGSGMDQMGNTSRIQSSSPAPMLPDNSIREGMYINKGQTLFWVNDFKEVWGILAFTKDELYLKKGQQLSVQSEMDPEHLVESTIQLIEQVYQQGQKFTQVRVHLKNTAGWKQHSLITATINIPAKVLLVPESSIYNLGRVAIAWVQIGISQEGSRIFEARAVRTGRQTGDHIEILEGLGARDEIAKNAGYLTDSETFIDY